MASELVLITKEEGVALKSVRTRIAGAMERLARLKDSERRLLRRVSVKCHECGAVAPAADDCSCRFSGDQADASDCVRHGNSVAPAAAVECGWHRPGVMDGGVRLCRSCAVPITECGCSNFGRTPKARCELCHGSGWVAKGAA